MNKSKIVLYNNMVIKVDEIAFMQLDNEKVILIFKGNNNPVNISCEDEQESNQLADEIYSALV